MTTTSEPKFSPFCGAVPQTPQRRREEYYARRAQHTEWLLLERVEYIDQLIGLGELPPNYWARRNAE